MKTLYLAVCLCALALSGCIEANPSEPSAKVANYKVASNIDPNGVDVFKFDNSVSWRGDAYEFKAVAIPQGRYTSIGLAFASDIATSVAEEHCEALGLKFLSSSPNKSYLTSVTVYFNCG